MSNFARLSFAHARRGALPHHCRNYATSGSASQGGSNSRMKLLAVAIGIPAAFYLWPRGSKKENVSSARGANQEYKFAAEGNQDQNENQKSAYDEPRAMGSPKGPNSMSFKQQGLSNADTMNPYVNEPGKSQKGEGETETAKVKGTVSPTRPQA